jgi:outer membrane protein
MLALAAFTFSTAHAEAKLAIIDIQTVLETSKEGKRAKDLLNKQAGERKTLIEKKKNELQKLESEFKQKRLVLKGNVLEEKQRELQEKTIELQKLVFDSENEFKQKHAKLTGDIVERIRSVATKIGVDKKFDMVIEKSAVVYYKSAFDLTKDVVKLYDKTYK